MSEDDSPENEVTPERQAWIDELFRLKDKIVLLALREAEWFYSDRTRREDPDVRAADQAVADEFETACYDYTMHQLKGIGIQ